MESVEWSIERWATVVALVVSVMVWAGMAGRRFGLLSVKKYLLLISAAVTICLTIIILFFTP